MLRPRNGSGMTSIGGSWRMRPTDVISSGVRLGPVAPGLEHLRGALPGEDQPAGEDGLEREERVLEGRDDAEVAAAAAQREEEVALVRVVDAVELAVGRDQLDRRQGVRGEAVLAGQPAHAATERVAGDADVRRGAVQDGEAVLGRGDDDVLPDRARADARLLRLDVDLHVAQLVHAHEHGIREIAERGDAVTGALGGHAQAVGRGEAHDRLHVGGVGGDDDQRGLLVESDVPRRARLVPAFVAGGEHGTADRMTQNRDINARSGVGCSHVGPRLSLCEKKRRPACRSRRVQRPQHLDSAPGAIVRSTCVLRCGYP